MSTRILFKAKDGGPESKVTGYWLIESKRVFSIVLLRFDNGSRESYHSHAFNSISWVLSGSLVEYLVDQCIVIPKRYYRSIFPIHTPKKRFHKVESFGTTWVLSFRGPWDETWKEYIPGVGWLTLGEHRKILNATSSR
jgi:hypothetical protein